MNCKRCGSMAINHSHHGRDGSNADLCDVCYWRTIAEADSIDATRYRMVRRLGPAQFNAIWSGSLVDGGRSWALGKFDAQIDALIEKQETTK